MIPPAVARLVDVLAGVVPDFAVTRENGRGRCIEATRLATAVLRRAGVAARPMACDVVAFNAEALSLFDEHVPIGDWPPSAWSRGASCDHTHPGPNLSEPYRRVNPGGHLVVASAVDDDWFVDLTVQQYHAADQGIVIDAAVATDEVDWTQGGIRWPLPTGGAVEWYWRPQIKAFRTTPAWRQDVDHGLVTKMAALVEAEA